MKNQTWGSFFYPEPSWLEEIARKNLGRPGFLRVDLPQARAMPLDDYEGKRKNRGGGSNPGDGRYTWVKGRVEGDYVYGVKESDGYYHYEVRYDEGPKDKAFMEEGDWAYIQGLIRDNTLLKKEPNADKEIATDHKYRAEITRALNEARAGIGSSREREEKERLERERLAREAKQQADREAREREGREQVKRDQEKREAEERERKAKEAEELRKKELEDLRKQSEKLKLEKEKVDADKRREEERLKSEAEKQRLQKEIEQQKRALEEEKEKVAKLKVTGGANGTSSEGEERVKKPKFMFSLQLIPYRTLTYGKVLGQGGFGRAYKGEWQHGEVAIKELLASSLSDVAMTEFRKETEIWGKLRHPNIVQLYGISTDEPSHYSMVMELMPNGSLYQVLHNGQPLNWELRFHIAKDIAAGLTHLHERDIVHCDLKSLNVLLDGAMRAKLTDFGLSKPMETGQVLSSMHQVGSIFWEAPELIEDEHGRPGKETDVYSFGMVLWEIASRKTPYGADKNPVSATRRVYRREKETVPEDCARTYPSYAALISACWEERSMRPTIQESAEVLKPLKALPEPLASGPVQLDNFASAAPR